VRAKRLVVWAVVRTWATRGVLSHHKRGGRLVFSLRRDAEAEAKRWQREGLPACVVKLVEQK
jgi:hypothetical protein